MYRITFPVTHIDSDSALLEMQDLSFSYLWIALSFKVRAGEMLQITGANGAGKTLLIGICTGLYVPIKTGAVATARYPSTGRGLP